MALLNAERPSASISPALLFGCVCRSLSRSLKRRRSSTFCQEPLRNYSISLTRVYRRKSFDQQATRGARTQLVHVKCEVSVATRRRRRLEDTEGSHLSATSTTRRLSRSLGDKESCVHKMYTAYIREIKKPVPVLFTMTAVGGLFFAVGCIWFLCFLCVGADRG